MRRLPSPLPLALCLAVSLAACGGNADDTVPGPGATDATSAAALCPDLPDATALLQALNTARSQPRACGATVYPATTALAWDTRLLAAARAHSLDMASRRVMDHTGADGSTAGDRISAAGYTWSTYGENIAAGQVSAQAVLDDWLGSEGHCANLMDTRFRDVALACARRDGVRYWTQVFGAPR